MTYPGLPRPLSACAASAWHSTNLDHTTCTNRNQSRNPPDVNAPLFDNAPWYRGITRYQWLVLVIASLGWVFDVFEGQIFVASMNEAMPTLLSEEEQQLPEPQRKGLVTKYNNYTFGAFLLG